MKQLIVLCIVSLIIAGCGGSSAISLPTLPPLPPIVEPIIEPPPPDLPPNAPQNVQASFPEGTYIHVKWDNNTESDLTDYYIYRYSIKYDIFGPLTIPQLFAKVEQETANDVAFIYYGFTGKLCTQFHDWAIGHNFVYGYKICAMDASGQLSEYSDLAIVDTL